MAGKRAGLEGERSGLFMEQMRVIKEMRNADELRGRTDESIRPRYLVWENVPGALSSNKGEDFRCVLEEIAKVIQEDVRIPRFEGGGHTAESLHWNVGNSHGGYTIVNTLESHNEGSASVCLLTSTDLRQQGFCLTLNLSEKPRVANPTLLSEILQEEADPKYNLSPKACKGILNRANKRGKKLPDVLREALEAQIRNDEQGN